MSKNKHLTLSELVIEEISQQINEGWDIEVFKNNCSVIIKEKVEEWVK